MLSSIDFLSNDFELERLISETQEEEDSSVEDEQVLQTDKVVVATYPSEEANSILFHVYSPSYFYPHHEISYPSVFFDCKVLKNDFVAVSSLNDDILVFDPKIKFVDSPSYILSGHDSMVLCLQMQEDLISGSEDKSIIFWDETRIKERLFYKKEITKMAVNGKFIAHFSGKNVVFRSKSEIIKEISFPDLEDLKIKDEKIFCSDVDGNLTVYDTRNFGNKVYKIHGEGINSFDFYEEYVVTGSDDKTIKVYDLNKGEVIKNFKVNGSVSCVKMEDDLCFYGGEETDLQYLDFKESKIIK